MAAADCPARQGRNHFHASGEKRVTPPRFQSYPVLAIRLEHLWQKGLIFLYIGKDMQMSQNIERSTDDPGYAPLSPETPSWGPPAGTDSSDPGYAPISPETPSWGPPTASDSNDPGYAPISPETPSWGPPASSGGSTGSSGGTTCTNCGNWVFIPPVVTIPGGSSSQSSSRLTNIRFLYAATGMAPVNIRLGNRTVINRLQFGNATPYYLENAGYQTIVITNANTGVVLFRGRLSFENGTAYTVAIVNGRSGLSLMQLADVPCTNRSAACVRAANLSPNSGGVDFFLTGAGRVFQNVGSYTVTNYRNILEGSYRAAVSETLPCTNSETIVMASTYVECRNTRIAIMDSASVSFMNGVSYTLYLIGLVNQAPSARILSLESDLVY